ncbi:MAG: magnesium transporter CorA family protein [Mycobacteriaceae bacterium]|nr:magnesium transporter CorA family protein [Mycobacteriaceae bacterium]
MHSTGRSGHPHGEELATSDEGRPPQTPVAEHGSAARRSRVWEDGRLVKRGVPEAELGGYLGKPGAVVWLDLCDPDPREFGRVASMLGLDPIAVEDALTARERTKLDRYANYLFLNVYDIAFDAESAELRTTELSAFVTENALVTVRSGSGLDLADLTARWDSEVDLRDHGVGFLLYGLLDYVVDGHFAVVQSLDAELEQLEDQLFDPGADDRALQRRSFALRKSLVLLRRSVLPMREVLNTVMRRDLRIIPDGMAPYYQDIYDHVLRATEWTEGLRDMVTSILDTRIALQGNRLNEVMKKVTSWAAIIAVPTAVTGFYGMNVPYPGAGTHWGFLISIVLLVITAGALYFAFKRNDWI